MTIIIPNDQPDASFGAIGSRYYGIYRLPHGRWRQLLGKDKQRLYFASAQEATRAAMAKVNSILFRPVVADRTEAASDPMAEALAAETVAFREDRRKQLAVERREVFRGLGKGTLTVETKRRRVGQ